MEKMKKSQILKLFLISALCIITPLLSTSFRPKYLCFIVNILIFAVGAESGLASFFLKAPEDKKPAQKSSDVYPGNEKSITFSNNGTNSQDHSTNKPAKVFEKSSSEKIADTVKGKLLELQPVGLHEIAAEGLRFVTPMEWTSAQKMDISFEKEMVFVPRN
ncbi:unnamed protein product [Fraxinus pennsylvanica]|uniref:DUF4408 domain-containing protein n=1 Tax=Fraxinus pennsylvanica TaxID=56036 RepID=A0AAD1YSR1_9LAMI|nr:unnamed protein product [Fraxinus pennsylvanica]